MERCWRLRSLDGVVPATTDPFIYGMARELWRSSSLRNMNFVEEMTRYVHVLSAIRLEDSI